MARMPSDSQTYYPLRLAARFCPLSSRTRRYPHVSALRRWVYNGLKTPDGKRVYLRAHPCPGWLGITTLAVFER